MGCTQSTPVDENAAATTAPPASTTPAETAPASTKPAEGTADEDAKVEAEADAEPETVADAESEAAVEAKTETAAETEPETAVEAEAEEDTEVAAKPEAEAEEEPEVKAETEEPAKSLYAVTGHAIEEDGVVYYTVEPVEGEGCFKKRYSEFKALMAELGKPKTLPSLPSGGLLSKVRGKHNAALIEEREAQLAVVLNAIGNDAELSQTDAFKTFLA